jgi:enoyl-CoA hydratase/3-hydroxyacyl-CoA dehydrogenase
LQEGEAFAAAAALDTHKALVHIFFATRSTKKVAGVSNAGLKPRKIARVAVLGGGLMGSGIATALVLAGVDVLLKEVNQQFLDVSAACNVVEGRGSGDQGWGKGYGCWCLLV